MKLLACPKCSEVFSLGMKEKSCSCGAVKGRYVTSARAEYSGPAIVIGFSNPSFIGAILDQRDHGDLTNGKGRTFEAFIIPQSAPSIKRVD